ncbi:GNAT family N-acetyltransferase [uncultured Clostridium sp.]|uniref:GNAT family N-acetyltransferase n=1 Tax=uncultured Clostridium sp. TaxID=59620 RepID=UPI00259607D8|nr:GNAT family N-acetyltransferase [uncultured Clostridium sp.]
MIKIESLNNINDKDIAEILDTWESAVRATHNFLSEQDIIAIKPQVIEGVKYVSKLLCVRDEKDMVKAFMGIHDFKIEMLFVNNESRGKGIGKKLVEHAIEELNVIYVDVNEENPQAVGFYKHMGFEVFKKSKFDEQGNPFPILHMKLKE